jgi:hypothetical protein
MRKSNDSSSRDVMSSIHRRIFKQSDIPVSIKSINYKADAVEMTVERCLMIVREHNKDTL